MKVPRQAASAHKEATSKCPETAVGEGGHTTQQVFTGDTVALYLKKTVIGTA